MIEGRQDGIAECYVTEVTVSQVTGRALSTLRNDRNKGRGIPYIKMKKSVRYYLPDVYKYMERHRIKTNPE